jgi:hypothetical protein
MATSKGNTGLNTEAHGHALALDMLDEMAEIGVDELVLDCAKECRQGRQQNNVLTRYLRIAQQSPEVERGFLAVITDILGAAAENCGGDDYRAIVNGAQAEVAHG